MGLPGWAEVLVIMVKNPEGVSTSFGEKLINSIRISFVVSWSFQLKLSNRLLDIWFEVQVKAYCLVHMGAINMQKEG